MYHKPVLLKESIEGLNIKPDGIYVDATFGGAGHSRGILSHLNKNGKLIAFDADSDALKNKPDDSRIELIHANYRFIKNFLYYLKINKVDGILADLGISSHQIDKKDRGFSYRLGGTPDMRMNTNQDYSAKDIINNYSLEELGRVFKKYSDIENPVKLAKRIIEFRDNNEINEIEVFTSIISSTAPKNRELKYISQVFQALRIEVNDEIHSLKVFLDSCAEILNKDGRLAIISYHSVEDKLVKNLIKTGNTVGKQITDIYGRSEQIFKPVNNKIIVPKEKEILENSRAKSAKLRIAEKL
jgi:16S rRNA (cytosine1402-N4)-methyltransferase